jgi:hypothetical protein
MRVIFYSWMAGHLAEIGQFSKPFFSEAPVLKYEFDLFEVQVDTQELDLVFYYNQQEAKQNGTARQQWNWFLLNHREVIGGITLQKDDGTILWEGVVDDDADISIDHNAKTLTISFIGAIAAVLDTTLRDAAPPASSIEIITGFYPYGEGALQDAIEQFFSLYLSGFTPHMPTIESWELNAPVPWYRMENFSALFYMGYRLVWSDETTILEALKDICALGGLRVVFTAQEAHFYAYRAGYRVVDPDGVLVEVGHESAACHDLSASLDENGGYSFSGEMIYRNSLDGQTLDYEAADFAGYAVPAWLNRFQQERSIRYSFSGFNKNLASANQFSHIGNTVIVIGIERDLAFLDCSKQPVDVQAEVIHE